VIRASPSGKYGSSIAVEESARQGVGGTRLAPSGGIGAGGPASRADAVGFGTGPTCMKFPPHPVHMSMREREKPPRPVAHQATERCRLALHRRGMRSRSALQSADLAAASRQSRRSRRRIRGAARIRRWGP
jgi:hypothetical protein